MSITISTEPNELTSLELMINATDSAGNSVTPTAAWWTLTSIDGSSIINSRKDVTISDLGTTMTVTLRDEDLAVDNDSDTERLFTVEGTYNKGSETGLAFKEEATFTIKNLKYVGSAIDT